MRKIPFSKNTFNKEEERAIRDCFRSGWVVLGPKTAEFEEKFAKYVGSKYAVSVDSGTSALFLSIRATGYKDFATIPSLTFVSSAEVIHNAGLKIKFADIDRETLCLDKEYDNCLPTNFGGVLAKSKGEVIDSCHRIEYDDVKDSKSLWCYSFYATKNLSTVQGGMIALNNKEKYHWLIKARDHGVTKGTIQRYKGLDPSYDVKFPAWRVKSDDLHAAIGLVQLKKLPAITERRNEIVARYNGNLEIQNTGNHLYPILVNERKKFIEIMFKRGIQTSIHFIPTHTFTAYKDEKVKLPVTDFVGSRIVSLPIFPDLTNKQVDYICKAVLLTKLRI